MFSFVQSFILESWTDLKNSIQLLIMQQRKLIKKVLIENDRWFIDIIIQVRTEDASYAETILRKNITSSVGLRFLNHSYCMLTVLANQQSTNWSTKEINSLYFTMYYQYCVEDSVISVWKVGIGDWHTSSSERYPSGTKNPSSLSSSSSPLEHSSSKHSLSSLSQSDRLSPGSS